MVKIIKHLSLLFALERVRTDRLCNHGFVSLSFLRNNVMRVELKQKEIEERNVNGISNTVRINLMMQIVFSR